MRVNRSTDLALTADGREVEQVKCFAYVGSTVSSDGAALEDVCSRIKKANGAFVQLLPVWRSKNISCKVTGKVHPITGHEGPEGE